MVNGNNSLGVPEELGSLELLEPGRRTLDIVDEIATNLAQDRVVLIRGIEPSWADELVLNVASRFDLTNSLKLQAGFAAFQGHRANVGKYFMSVNRRDDYQFITPHSEGTLFVGLQLAAFYCFENSTDGGETILMNINGRGEAWKILREKVKRGKITSGSLAPGEVSRAKGLYQLRLPEDVLQESDRILEEYKSDISGLTILDVLAKPQTILSRILGSETYVYWDSVSSIDFDSAIQFVALLRDCKLLKEPNVDSNIASMDNARERRVWHSGMKYSQLFKRKITHKLSAGELVFHNNLTWAHSVSNWTPGSGIRKVVASFA